MSTSHVGKTGLSASFGDHKASQANAQQNPKNAQQLHSKTARQPKTSVAFWLAKVRKPDRSPHYGVQIAYRGQRHRFPLETANREAAAEKARSIHLCLVAGGWKATLEKHKPETVKRHKAATVGALIEAATRLSSARRESMEAYTQALRRIASGVLGLRDGTKRNPLKAPQWRAKVDATPLDRLTPAAVLAWKNSFLREAKAPEARNSAAVTFNALLRNSKALLSKKIRPFIEKEIPLPSPLWFEGVSREKEPSLRYHSKIDAGEILNAAQAELAVAQPEVFKALLLTLVCGLRRSEADKLLWRQFDLDAGTLEIADTEHKALKSADSAGVIGLDAELVALLKGFRARASSVFVLEEPPRRREAPKRNYRCDVHFEALIQWLKGKGVPGIRPIHTLRKEIGSVIASRDGIFAASRYLRHSNISITSKLYADSKTPVCAGLGSLLAHSPGNVIEAAFVGEKGKQATKEAQA
ncbi:MAG: hypothetical protein ACOYMN_05235 [Roseimicrobium sp.]